MGFDFSKAKILCVGDVMLDEYVYGDVHRISPEAPIPVLRVTSKKSQLGGAGNVARNIAALGASCTFVSILGKDAEGSAIMRLIGEDWPKITPFFTIDKHRETTLKKRFIAGSQQLLRSDRETTDPISQDNESAILRTIIDQIPPHDVLVISDYDKGMLTSSLIASIIKYARAMSKMVIVDPKTRPFRIYSGASIITPNIHEFNSAGPHHGMSMVEHGRQLIRYYNFGRVLITRGDQGMTYVTNTDDHHWAALAHEIVDVSGAGDTVVAALAVAKACDYTWHDACELSNRAAGIAVAKKGTATITAQELEAQYR